MKSWSKVTSIIQLLFQTLSDTIIETPIPYRLSTPVEHRLAGVNLPFFVFMFLCSNFFLLFASHSAFSLSSSVLRYSVMELWSDLPTLRRRKWPGCCHLSSPALTQMSTGEAHFFSVCRRASTGSELFSGCTRRTFSRIKTYCRGSQSYVKRPVVSVEGDIVTSLTVARSEQKSSFSVASSQISSAFPISAYLLQRCSVASHSAKPIDGLSDNLSVTLMGLVLLFHYYLFGIGLGLDFSLVDFEIVCNALKKKEET